MEENLEWENSARKRKIHPLAAGITQLHWTALSPLYKLLFIID